MNILTKAQQAPDPAQPAGGVQTMQTMQATAAPGASPPKPPGSTAAANFDANAAAGPMQGPTELKVTDNMLASKQLDSILSRDNPLMQKARARAAMAANRRGLLNSSMAVQAGESAAIDAALPLAQQDASTNFQAGQFNAGASNDFSRDTNRFGRDVSMAKLGAEVGAEEKAADREFQGNQNLLEREFQGGQRQLDRQQQVTLQQMGQQFQMDFEKFRLPLNMMSGFTDRMQDYVGKIMSDPNLDAAAKDQAVANYYSYAQQTMGWMSTFFGKPMPNMTGGAPVSNASPTVPTPSVGLPSTQVPVYLRPPPAPIPINNLPVRQPVAPPPGSNGRMALPMNPNWGAFR